MSDPIVLPDDVAIRTGLVLDEQTAQRTQALIADAEEIIADEFDVVGRNYETEKTYPRTRRTIARVVREMVAAAIVVGPYAGARSSASTTGPQSDSITWDKVPQVQFSGVVLTDPQRRELGLIVGSDYAPAWIFPQPTNWPHSRLP